MRALALIALVAGCTVGGSSDLPDPASGAHSAAAGAASAVATHTTSAVAAPVAPAAADFREAVRSFDYARAWQLMEALPPSELGKPEIRLVRGRVALELGNHAEAVRALDGLETLLPLAREEISGWYAAAAAVAGPHEAAAKHLEASPKVRDMIAAARAWHAGGDLKKARASADRAVKRAERNRRKTGAADAHLARAAIAEAAGSKNIAAADYQWFVKNRPRDPRVRDAIAGVDRVGGRLTLTDRLEALTQSSTPLNIADTLAAIDALGEQHKTQAASVAFARARALYTARDYVRARTAFEDVAKLPSTFVAEAKYYAARAAERMGDQEGAATQYADIARRFRKNGYAERGAYRYAETLLLLGQFDQAATEFAKYLSRFGKTKSTESARYGQAVALLSAGKAAKARKLLSGLRKDAQGRRFKANLQHLEGLAALRAGDRPGAVKLWLDIINDQPLTYPAMAAHARLGSIGHAPLPPLIDAARRVAHSALPLTLPGAPALLKSLGLDDSAALRLSRMEQQAASGYPGRESEALCEMYGQLAVARRRYQVGSRAVSLEVLMRAPTNAERWAWRCVYPYPYAEVVRHEQQRYALPPGLVHAIMRQESAFKTTIVSPVGAQGLMQLMPNTAKRAADESGYDANLESVTRPDLNVRLGAFYLGKLLGNFKQSLALATAGYNAGPHAVQRWLSSSGDRETDLWIARIPYRETRHYVQRVLGNLARYQYLAGGVATVTPLALELPEDTSIGDNAY